MKTAEERAEEIENEAFDDWCFDRATKQYKGAFDRDECAALIRADREAVLKRVAEGLKMIAWQAVEADPEKINTLCNYVVAAVKKEVCG